MVKHQTQQYRIHRVWHNNKWIKEDAGQQPWGEGNIYQVKGNIYQVKGNIYQVGVTSIKLR